jgi:hypothetical protein
MTSALGSFLKRFKASSPLTYAEARKWFTPEQEIKFWKEIKKSANGCWEWKGGTWDSGYGRFYVGRRPQRVHRLVYMLARGRDIPAYIDERDIPDQADAWEHMRPAVIRHRCDNPRCCRIDHLVVGTHKENNADTAERERTEAARRTEQERQDRTNVQAVYNCFLANHCETFKRSPLNVYSSN